MATTPQPRPAPGRRGWSAKFADALRGVKLGVRGHSSFFVHGFAAAVVIVAAAILNLDLLEWCLLLASITAVFAAELFNSAIEILARVIELERRPGGKDPLDIAAGAVLTVAIGAAIIGIIIFATRLKQMIS